MRQHAAEIQRLRDTTHRPILYSGARIRTEPSVLSTAVTDLLVQGERVVAMGSRVFTAVRGDPAFVIDCSGFDIVPVAIDRADLARRRRSRTPIEGTFHEGRVATFAIAARTTPLSGEYDLPHDFVAVIDAGRPVAWNGVWLDDADRSTGAPHRATASPADDSRVGSWVDTSASMTQELRTDGRYDETRSGRKHAFQGAYWIDGDCIDYLDDLGFWAYGKFIGDTLEHAGFTMRHVGRGTSPA